MINAQKILVIKSEISQLKRVESFLYEVFLEFKLSQKNFNKVFLCISEAVVNSIEHGNKNDKNKTVSIGVDCNKNQIEVYIKDEGLGFNIDVLEDPTQKSNLKKESGRGIHIIKSLSDKIEYNSKENFIRFKIICSG